MGVDSKVTICLHGVNWWLSSLYISQKSNQISYWVKHTYFGKSRLSSQEPYPSAVGTIHL